MLFSGTALIFWLISLVMLVVCRFVNSSVFKDTIHYITALIFVLFSSYLASWNKTEFLIMALPVIGTYFIIRKDDNRNQRGLYLLLGMALIYSDSLIFNALGLLLFIKELDFRKSTVQQKFLSLYSNTLLLTFPLITLAYGGGHTHGTLVKELGENTIVQILFLLILLIPTLRIVLEGVTKKSLFLWVGVIQSFLIFLANKTQFFKALASSHMSQFLIILAALLVIILIVIEKYNATDERLMGVLLFNQLFSILGLLVIRSDVNLLILSNFIILLLFFMKDFKLGILMKVIIGAFLVCFPGSIWFKLQYGLIERALDSKMNILFICFVIISGLHFRQRLIILVDLLRPLLPHRLKAS